MRFFQKNKSGFDANDIMINADLYKTPKKTKDSMDGLVRAIKIDEDFISKSGNSLISSRSNKKINLKENHYLTSNGNVINEKNFKNIYSPVTNLINEFIDDKILKLKPIKKENTQKIKSDRKIKPQVETTKK